MRIETLGSGSSGNCHILTDDDGNSLILDAGIKSKDIKIALEYDFSKVCGILVTHSHKDHSLSADEFELLGIDVYRPYLIDGGKDKRTFGKFAVQTFGLQHDGCPCCGFYIRHINGFKMLYLTDFEYCQYRFTKLNVDLILVECNWSREFVETEKPNAQHKILGHASSDVTKEFIRVNATENLKNVAICHISNAVDVPKTIAEIEEIVPGVRVDCAEKGKVIEI